MLSQLSQVGFQRVLGELGLLATPSIYHHDSRLWCGIHSCKQLPLQVPLPKVPMILTSRISVATFRAALLHLSIESGIPHLRLPFASFWSASAVISYSFHLYQVAFSFYSSISCETPSPSRFTALALGFGPVLTSSQRVRHRISVWCLRQPCALFIR